MKRSDPPFHQRWALYRSDLGDYMRRWILRTPWGTLRIHNILKSDEGRDFHDHPFSFASFVLRGGYIEHRPGCQCDPPSPHLSDVDWCAAMMHQICDPNPCRQVFPGEVVRRKATDLHRLELDRPAWTLVITSRYFRMWGFQTAKGWIPYREYERSYE